ncbi:MAG: hypothetical protein FWB71_04495, partial [Defluviitaleaceae bacterium]|nr:hypothetical protein [Defluviitaleaceae bacterium]
NIASKRILIVDDDKINREMTVELLNSTGLLIDTAESVIEAAEIIAAVPGLYDMALMNTAMAVAISAADIENFPKIGITDSIGKSINMKGIFEMLTKYL